MEILESAAEIRHLGWKNAPKEYEKFYLDFCKATGNRDISPDNFEVYVLKFGVRDKMIYTKDELDMASYRDDMTRKMVGYREQIIGRYYANR